MAEAASGVRAAIDQDRAELAETVQALVHKTDVSARVRESASEKVAALEQRAEETITQVKQKPMPFAVAGAVLIAGVVLVCFMRARKKD